VQPETAADATDGGFSIRTAYRRSQNVFGVQYKSLTEENMTYIAPAGKARELFPEYYNEIYPFSCYDT